ncbi:hypothetical protein DMH01_14720 [Amycolatopsis sp. WAC 04182]|uniref:hypothetical protein n=1 Tax=Amycolatopsis TaxID=1813 RepID=UPI0009F9AB3A|nr:MULTISPECIES: hypothetical protein [Amycolatopsis]RSN60555.1 hypothetical protein DMH01_14720 [Amycolatopsis sp. WAC 04182]
MQAVLAAGIAVIGTLLGSTVAYVFQRRQAQFVHSMASHGRMRDEQILAFSSFAEAIADLRGAQIRRWTSRQEDQPDSEPYTHARTESWRLRTVARSAMYRVQLVTADEALASRARELVEFTVAILEAADVGEMEASAKRSAAETNVFITEARRVLSSDRAQLI